MYDKKEMIRMLDINTILRISNFEQDQYYLRSEKLLHISGWGGAYAMEKGMGHMQICITVFHVEKQILLLTDHSSR